VRVRAFAKINLSLHVVGTRADGYHELRTIFQSIALHDTLTIERVSGPLSFTCDDPACPPDPSNLVWRAANAMWTASGGAGAARGVRITLAKRIPMQAGLGGGSSDCAAALRLLGRMWRVPVVEQLRIGASLGADVPYFFVGGRALGVERGDRIEPMPDAKAAWVVLVLPSFGVSTEEAFSWWDADQGPRTRRQRSRDHNDLERSVAKRHPAIAKLVRSLKRLGASQSAMTGSGSTVFGLFSRQNDALDAASALFGGGHRTLITRTVNRRMFDRDLAAK
jgi:4-diphosphocytidyl-2-C-methyl-D-erythritol kinase